MKRRARILKTLLSCYRDYKDDRLLDTIEVLIDEFNGMQACIPPIQFFDQEGRCVMSTQAMVYSGEIVEKEKNTDSTVASLQEGETDSSGVVPYFEACPHPLDDDDDENSRE